MGIGDVIVFSLTAFVIMIIAFIGAVLFGGLLCVGIFLGKIISRTLPELWDKIPNVEDFKNGT